MTDLNRNDWVGLYMRIVVEQRKECEVCSKYPNYICGYHEAFFDGVEHALRKHVDEKKKMLLEGILGEEE